jgi:hypothetical protein
LNETEINQTMLGVNISVEPQGKLTTTWGELKD